MEVDLLLDRGDRLDALEIKAGETVAGDFFKPLEILADLLPDRQGRRALAYGGQTGQNRSHADVLPWFGVAEWLG